MKGCKIIDSRVAEVGSFATEVSNDDIRNEPMFFNCDVDFSYKHGGPITRSFLDNLPAGWDGVFDSRVHMLMKGWYPAIPGYHHDDVPRPDIPAGQHFITAGQPDYDNPTYKSNHILGLVNADVAPTHFALGKATFPEIPDGELIYRAWHLEVLDKIMSGELTPYKTPDRTLLQFNWQSWHQGVEAVGHGWRWFGRVSKDTGRLSKITNEIRVNSQVYMKFPMEGW